MRPIDADKLKNSYGWWEGNSRQLTRDEVRHYFDGMIDAQATVEAEIKHGHWIRLNGDSRFMCSVCKWKENVPTCNGEPTIWDYCPSCGARMDEVDNET